MVTSASPTATTPNNATGTILDLMHLQLLIAIAAVTMNSNCQQPVCLKDCH